MKFYARIELDGIRHVEYVAHARTLFSRADDHEEMYVTDPIRAAEGRMFLCTREFGDFALIGYCANDHTACLCYDDFEPGLKPTDRPVWFYLIKDRIISTSASEEYGTGQKIRVAEFLYFKTATARIRCEQSIFVASGCVFRVKIKANGRESLADALELHARILSGDVYRD